MPFMLDSNATAPPVPMHFSIFWLDANAAPNECDENADRNGNNKKWPGNELHETKKSKLLCPKWLRDQQVAERFANWLKTTIAFAARKMLVT